MALSFGHGTLKDENGRVLHLGGSTGGTTREVLDNSQQPSAMYMERFVRGSIR
jgi:spermidine synthase